MTVSVRGDAGQCEDLPSDAVAIALNVTALGATAPTFLTFWPGGELPNASSLNPAPGQPPAASQASSR